MHGIVGDLLVLFSVTFVAASLCWLGDLGLFALQSAFLARRGTRRPRLRRLRSPRQ